jgi:hypothetical protein
MEIAASVIAAFEAIVLMHVFERLKHFQSMERIQNRHLLERALHTQLPAFHLPLTNGDGWVGSDHWSGRAFGILIVSAADCRALPGSALQSVVCGIAGRTSGAICIVCNSTPHECRAVLASLETEMSASELLAIVSDPTGSLSSSLGVEVTPVAFVVDENHRIVRVGMPIGNDQLPPQDKEEDLRSFEL